MLELLMIFEGLILKSTAVMRPEQSIIISSASGMGSVVSLPFTFHDGSN